MELLTSMSTQCFMMALERFAAVFSMPDLIISDNGTNFRRAAKELSQMEKDLWEEEKSQGEFINICLLYTSPSPRDLSTSRMPSSA